MSDVEQRLQKAEWVLRSSGFRPCDIAACNCGSWHQVEGFKARFDEIKEVVEEAGYSTNGVVLLDAVKHMIFDLERLGSALEPFIALRDQSPSETTKVIHKDLDGLTTVTVTVTNDQFNDARRALKFKRI